MTSSTESDSPTQDRENPTRGALPSLGRAAIHSLRGAVGATCLLVAELLLVMMGSGGRIASVWELQFGLFGLLPSICLLVIATGGASAITWALLTRASKPWARIALTALVFAFVTSVGYGVGGGRHLADLGARLSFAFMLGAAVASLGYLVLPRLRALTLQHPMVVAGVFAVLALSVELANAHILVRLYPAFHLGSSAAALLLAGLSSLVSAQPGAPRWAIHTAPVALISLVSFSGIALEKGARFIAGFDNLRVLLLERSPVLGQLVTASAQIAPPPPLETGDCDPADCFSLSKGSSRPSQALDLRGRDLLLITIDALRADHLGASGYHRPTSPHIDRLAETGVFFEYAYAPTPHTSYSITSLMTGKYMRPLLLQNAGEDSTTWADLLRTYGYRTAAFYPPAVFFIDEKRFKVFQDAGLGFEYRKVEFAEGEHRLAQVRSYLDKQTPERQLFLWVHVFLPHEPYTLHESHDFGDQDIDRYDSEIAAADEDVSDLVKLVREHRPDAVVALTSDHGEEFGEHGGRYHGTTVYEEQVRVPLILNGKGLPVGQRITAPVQTIDLLPTILSGLEIPRPPTVRGRDLISHITNKDKGFALAETDEQVLLAEASLRLICQRRVGACQLYDLETDPEQKADASHAHRAEFDAMRSRLKKLAASHGRYETKGLRAEGKGWPEAILRGVTGDGQAVAEIANLLDDADLQIRRKAAELLFELGNEAAAPALRLALTRAEDKEVRNYAALALTRLGQGAPLTFELVKSGQKKWRRLAALALAEAGDHRGADILVRWWLAPEERDFKRSKEILEALGKTRSKDAVWPLVKSLDDVRLRPFIAQTLAAIGDEFSRGPLLKALKNERYQTARLALTQALVDLGAGVELAPTLTRFLGVPDPLPNGLGFALKAGILQSVGGPDPRSLAQLRKRANVGVAISVIVPKGSKGVGVRVLVRARSVGSEAGSVLIGKRTNLFKFNKQGEPILIRDIPRLDSSQSLRLEIPIGEEASEVHAVLPSALGVRPGKGAYLVVFADRHVQLDAIALVPLAEELPPPAPKAWGSKNSPDEPLAHPGRAAHR